MTKVIKRGGKRQRFLPRKIKRTIRKAAKEARLSPARARKLTKEISDAVIEKCKKRKVIKTSEIRKTILARLAKKAKSVASAWKKFEKRKQGRF